VLAHEEVRFKEELREAAALLGRIPEYQGGALFEDEPRSAQEDRRRKLERLKIRLEEAGLGNSGEILKEHKETTERDAFLERELADLEASALSLRALIEDLTKTLETRFVDGIDLINKEFNDFFKLMFGGGSASLSIVKEKKLKRGAFVAGEGGEGEGGEEQEVEEGVEITIALPHKRIKGLHMLSGGERALTSIALIFAMSQVNPPPFIILDETDAALDEANSRRYGDMIESLSRFCLSPTTAKRCRARECSTASPWVTMALRSSSRSSLKRHLLWLNRVKNYIVVTVSREVHDAAKRRFEAKRRSTVPRS